MFQRSQPRMGAVELAKEVEGAGFGLDPVDALAEGGGIDLASGERLDGLGGAVDEEFVVGRRGHDEAGSWC